MKAAVPHRHGEIVTSKDERRREMQRVKSAHLMGETELGRTLDEILIDLDRTERRPLPLVPADLLVKRIANRHPVHAAIKAP